MTGPWRASAPVRIAWAASGPMRPIGPIRSGQPSPPSEAPRPASARGNPPRTLDPPRGSRYASRFFTRAAVDETQVEAPQEVSGRGDRRFSPLKPRSRTPRRIPPALGSRRVGWSLESMTTACDVHQRVTTGSTDFERSARIMRSDRAVVTFPLSVRGPWCNGSTLGFGPRCPSSNLGGPVLGSELASLPAWSPRRRLAS